MSQRTIIIVATIVVTLLVSTAGLIAASPSSPADLDNSVALADSGPNQVGPPEGVSIKLEGFVTAVDAENDTIQVNGVTIIVDDDTEIEPEGTSIEDLIDQFVEVKATLEPAPGGPPTITAEKIEVKEDFGDGDTCQKVEFHGSLTSFDGTEPDDEWTIETHMGEVTVVIDENTEIEGEPVVGARVKVEACQDSETLVAVELEVRGRFGDEDRRVLRGRISERAESGDNLILTLEPGEWLVQLATDVAILPPFATADDLTVGQRILAHGEETAEDPEIDLIAFKVVLLGRGHPEADAGFVRIEGAISAAPESSDVGTTDIITGEWAIEGIPFVVGEDTLVAGPEELAEGVWTRVDAVVELDDSGGFSYRALRAITKSQGRGESGEVFFVGVLETDNPSSETTWMVSKWPFDVGTDTEIRGPMPEKGDRIWIEATHGGTYHAEVIQTRGLGHR